MHGVEKHSTTIEKHVRRPVPAVEGYASVPYLTIIGTLRHGEEKG